MILIDYIKKPYPLSHRKWPLILSISIFISFFMLMFQPFGLQFYESENKALYLSGYGLVTFFILVLNLIILPLIFTKFLSDDRWSIIKQVLWLSWIVSTISAGNYVYSSLLSITHWMGIQGFLIFLGFTFIIALFPIVGITVVNHNRLLKRNLKSSSSINAMMKGYKDKQKTDMTLLLKSDSGKQEINLLLSELLYIESDGNYLEIWRLNEGKPKSEIMRSTLISIEAQLPASDMLFKCHRAFIINLIQIKTVKGNSQGYRAVMKSSEKEIPVARGYSKSFKEALEAFR